jgi:hypothetical protein
MRITGADPGLQARGRGGGAHLKKLRRAKGCAKIFRVFRVKKSRSYAKKINFLPILERAARPPLDPPLDYPQLFQKHKNFILICNSIGYRPGSPYTIQFGVLVLTPKIFLRNFKLIFSIMFLFSNPQISAEYVKIGYTNASNNFNSKYYKFA